MPKYWRYLILLPTISCAVAPKRADPPVVERAPVASEPSDEGRELVVEDSCSDRALSFRPSAGARYMMVVEEAPTRTPYRSEIRFTRREGGWSAVETNFSGPFAPSQVGNLEHAELRWQLDAKGVPVAPPEQRGGGRPEVLSNLSLFAFRPVGFALASTCAGQEGQSNWTDSAQRKRAFHFSVKEVDRAHVLLEVDGSVSPPTSVWNLTGEMSIALEDGISGEARMRETGPGASAVNDRIRVIRISRRAP
jgi:hypothetical protein